MSFTNVMMDNHIFIECLNDQAEYNKNKAGVRTVVYSNWETKKLSWIQK